MKRIFTFLSLVLASSLVLAQNIEITPFGGFTNSSRVSNYGWTYKVANSGMVGAAFDYQIDELTYLEFSVRSVNSSVNGKTAVDPENSEFDVGIQHLQVGVLQEFMEGTLVPFALGGLGGSRYYEKDNKDNSAWRFSAEVGLGAKLFLTDNIGLRVQTSITAPLEFSGVGLFCGWGLNGPNCSTGTSFRVPIVHWDVAAGLIIRIPN